MNTAPCAPHGFAVNCHSILEGGIIVPITWKQIQHPFAPVWDESSRVLVLGTFPSVQSRANAFYYGHPQNRFWRVLAMLFGQALPESIDQKVTLLKQHHIALWDVLAACDISGSADATIRNPVANDIPTLLARTPDMCVFANGQAAAMLYRRHIEPVCGVPVHALPSTSPANAAWTLPRLLQAWQPLLDCVQPDS